MCSLSTSHDMCKTTCREVPRQLITRSGLCEILTQVAKGRTFAG